MERTTLIPSALVGILGCVYFGSHMLAQGARMWPLTGFFFGSMALGAAIGVWQVRRARPVSS
ncbi:MAG: hypothetical protein ABI119_11875 [Gemmatimonadaceae bacterium]